MHGVMLDYSNEMVLKVMRDRFVADLIFNRGSNKSLRERMLSFNLNPYMKFPAVAVFEACRVTTAEQRKRRSDMEQIQDLMEQNVSSGNAVFLTDTGRIGLLFSWSTRGILEEIKQQIETAYSTKVTIGVGGPCSRIEEIHQSYQQAEQSIQDQFYQGKGQIIYFSPIRSYHNSCEYPAEMEREILESLKSEDTKAVRQAVEGFYAAILENGPVQVNLIFELTIRLVVGLEKRVFSELQKESAFKKCEIMTVVHMQTLQEIKDYVFDYLTDLQKLTPHQDKEIHRSIIKKTLQYMEHECREATLHNIAEKVFMTPTYLSQLFKQNTGKTFIDQLTDIRMEKAKHLLKTTHLKNYEVAEMIGYQDSRYFSQIFKKKVGLSPSEYRESLGS